MDNHPIYTGDIVKHCWLDDDFDKIGVVISYYGEYKVVGFYDFLRHDRNLYWTKKYSGNIWYQTTLMESITAEPPVKFKIVGNFHDNADMLREKLKKK